MKELSNFLASLKLSNFQINDHLYHHNTKLIDKTAQFLLRKNFIKNIYYKNKYICVTLEYINGQSAIKEIEIFSSTSNKKTAKFNELLNFYLKSKSSGYTYVVSTSIGILTLEECLLYHVGGLIIFKIK